MLILSSLGAVKFVNTDKFNIDLESYDATVTLDVDTIRYGSRQVNIKYVTLSNDKDAAYNITTTDDWDIYVSPENATLIDYDPAGKNQAFVFDYYIVLKLMQALEMISLIYCSFLIRSFIKALYTLSKNSIWNKNFKQC